MFDNCRRKDRIYSAYIDGRRKDRMAHAFIDGRRKDRIFPVCAGVRADTDLVIPLAGAVSPTYAEVRRNHLNFKWRL